MRETLEQLQKRCDDWNAKHSVGTKVRYWPAAGQRDFKVVRTDSAATVMAGHSAVIMLEGVSGCVSLKHVEAILPDAARIDRATKAIYPVMFPIEKACVQSQQANWELAKKVAIAALNAADDTCEAAA